VARRLEKKEAGRKTQARRSLEGERGKVPEHCMDDDRERAGALDEMRAERAGGEGNTACLHTTGAAPCLLRGALGRGGRGVGGRQRFIQPAAASPAWADRRGPDYLSAWRGHTGNLALVNRRGRIAKPSGRISKGRGGPPARSPRSRRPVGRGDPGPSARGGLRYPAHGRPNRSDTGAVLQAWCRLEAWRRRPEGQGVGREGAGEREGH